jgi:hypothetical protein
MHTRSIRVQGYAREDGLWDVEAELIDTKPYDFTRKDGTVYPAGAHLHHMHLRITIDERFDIVAAQAVFDAAPYGGECTSIDTAYQDLVGMNLLKNFRQRVKERFGRTAGCTHMTELSLVLPTAAMQSMAKRRRENGAAEPERRPFQLGGCHAQRLDGPVVREHYPRWYTGPLAEGDTQAESKPSDTSSLTHTT